MSNQILTGSGIRNFIDELNPAIEKLNISRHNKLWLQLFLEETLLKYQDVLGDKITFSYTIKKRLSFFLVELLVEGKSVNVLSPEVKKGDDSDILYNLFNDGDGQILYRYKDSQNIISVSMPIDLPKLKIPGSAALHAIILAIVAGFPMRFLPEMTVTMLVNDYISPIYSVLMELLKGLMGPVIFISLVTGICMLDDLRKLSTIGKSVLLSFFKFTSFSFAISAIVCMFVFPSNGSQLHDINFAEIIQLVSASIPKNIFAAFYEGNILQIVVLGFFSGILILTLGEKTTMIKKLVIEFKYFFFSALEMFVKIIPVIVFLSVVKAILTINISDSAIVWKLIVINQVLVAFIALIKLIHTSVKTKTTFRILLKKVMPLFSVAFSTGSSTAVIPEFFKRLPSSFGIDEKYANYWIPLSNSFFSPSTITALVIYAFFSAQMQGVGHSIGWWITLYIMIIQISIATPKIPGGIIASCSILFTQLGMTTDQIGIIMTANVLSLYLDVATAAIVKCCCAINVAQKQNTIDLDKLRDPEV